MDDVSTIDNRIIALLQEARDEAYARGWQDAIRSIVSAATNSAPAVGGGWVLRSEGHLADNNHTVAKKAKNGNAETRAPWGLSDRAVDAALDRAGDRGVDFDEVRAVARELEGHDLAVSSVRTTCLKKVRRGEVIKRNGRWFKLRAAQTETAGAAHEATPAVPLYNYQGGTNGTALVS